MTNEERLTARVAMMASGASGWVSEAEEQGLDEEAIAEMEQAADHTRAALEILDPEEE